MSEPPAEDPYPWLPLGTWDGSTGDGVAGWLKVDPDDPQLAEVRSAAADYVEGTKRDLWVDVVDESDPPVVIGRLYAATPRVVQAGKIAAARLWARKTSAAGLVSYGEFGASEILRLDPDVERLLGVGRYALPVIG